MVPNDFSPPDDCKACQRLADEGQVELCYGCGIAAHKHELHAFAMACNRFVARWRRPDDHATPLVEAGIITKEECDILELLVSDIADDLGGVETLIGEWLGTNIDEDVYASGGTRRTQDLPTNDLPPLEF